MRLWRVVDLCRSFVKRGVWVWLQACLFLFFSQALTASDAYHFVAPSSGSAFERDYQTQTYSGKDGFPARRISAIVRGPNQFLWMGTEQGLYRFDGRRFQGFNHLADGGQNSIEIEHLVFDSDGILWIGTEDGLSFFDGRIIRPSSDRRLASARVLTLEAARAGGIWIGCDHGLYLLRERKVRYWGEADGLADSQVMSIAESSEGQILIGTRKGVQSFRYRSGEFSRRQLPHRPFEGVDGAGPFMASVGDLLITDSGAIFALFGLSPTPSYALHRWRENGWRRVYADGVAIEGHELVADVKDPDAIWITGAAEFKRLDTKAASVRVFKPTQLIKGDYVITLFEPKVDAFLATVIDKGVIVGLRKFHRELHVNQRLRQGDTIRSVTGGRGQGLFIGADSGGYYEHNEVVRADGDTDLLNKNLVRSVLIGADACHWKGTKNGLFRKPKGEANWSYVDLDGWLLGQAPTVMFEDSQAQLWIGTSGGAVVLDRELDVHSIDLNAAAEAADIRGVGQGASGGVWLLVQGRGAFQVSSEYRIINHIGSKEGLNADGLTSLFVGGEGNLWLGGQGGLWIWLAGTLRSFSGSEGVPERVELVHRDKNGLLWLGHAGGLNVMPESELLKRLDNPKQIIRSRFFGRETGVPMGSIRGAYSQPTVYESHDGIVWFCAENGVFGFDSSCVHESLDDRVPSVVVSEVIADGQSMISDSPLPTGELVAVSTVGTIRLLELGFVAPTTVLPKAVRYRCRLEGYDEEWMSLGADSHIRYTNLNPGTYRILVGASYPYSGNWQYSVPVTLVVHPEYYQTLWFRGLCLGTVGTFGVFLYWWRARFVRRIFELEKMATVYREKQRISKNLHDDLGAEVTKLMMMVRNLRKQLPSNQACIENIEAAVVQAKRVGWQIRQTVWDVSPEPVSLPSFVAKLEMELGEQMRHADIRLVLDVERIDEAFVVEANTAYQLKAMVKEIASNAMKHSRARQFYFSASLQGSHLSLSFGDDGCGFTDFKQVAGHGLSNLRSRADSIGAEFSIESNPGAGCRVSVVLDLAKERDSNG